MYLYSIICVDHFDFLFEFDLFMYFEFSVTRVSGVRIRKLEVPEMAQAGHEVHLLCDYDLERARLYQV